MGLLDTLKQSFNPETLISSLEGMIPPIQRRMMEMMPRLMQYSYSIRDKPLPEITIKEKPEERKVAVVYTFQTVEDAHAFYEHEQRSLALLQMMDKELKANIAKGAQK